MSEPACCPTCQRPLDLTRYCSDCGATFQITYKDQAFYLTRKLELPKRCPECRQARKLQRQTGA